MLDEPKVGGEILVDGKVRTIRWITAWPDGACTLFLESVEGHPSVIELGTDGDLV